MIVLPHTEGLRTRTVNLGTLLQYLLISSVLKKEEKQKFCVAKVKEYNYVRSAAQQLSV